MFPLPRKPGGRTGCPLPGRSLDGETMTKHILCLFFIASLAAGCSTFRAPDSTGVDAGSERQDRLKAGSGGAPADGKGTGKKDVK